MSARTLRYVTYANVHGRSPNQQRRHDRKAWPGGRACGFQLWVSSRWQTFRKARRIGTWDILYMGAHQDFDQELLALKPCPGCLACKDPQNLQETQ